MKPLFFLALLALFFSGSCKKEEPELKLPPYTQEGNNIFACKVNGEIFIAEGKINWNSLELKGTNYISYRDSLITRDSIILIKSKEETPFNADFGLNFIYDGIQPSLLKNGQWTSAYIYKSFPGKQLAETKFTTDANHTGNVDVKYFHNNVIAGTFQFDATDEDGNIVHVTEGRFDISTTK